VVVWELVIMAGGWDSKDSVVTWKPEVWVTAWGPEPRALALDPRDGMVDWVFI